MEKKSNILLTGHTGFLGEVIYKTLVANHNVDTLARTNAYYSIDLANEKPVFDKQYDTVIHAAGKAHIVPRSTEEIESFYRVNVLGTRNLIESLEVLGTPRNFVFISSVAVYGLDKGVEIPENAPLLGKTPYATSKIQIENILLDWGNKSGVKITILRLPLIAGKNPPGNLGAMIKGIMKGYYFNIGSGQARKSMVRAEDVADIVLKSADIGGIYNLTDGYHPSFSELAAVISLQLKKRNPYHIPYWLAYFIALWGDLLRLKSPLNSGKLVKITNELTFSDAKAREVLGWNPKSVLKKFEI